MRLPATRWPEKWAFADMILTDIDLADLKRFILFDREAGFADRFIRLRRALRASKKLRVPVFVYWPINSTCNDHYLSFFEQINDVCFVDEKTASLLRSHPHRIDESLIKKKSGGWLLFGENLSMLRLKAEYADMVKSFVVQNNIVDTIGFHVRKTDLVKKEKKWGLTIQYQIFDQVAEKSTTRIFLSSDSEEVRKGFLDKYGDRIVLYDAEFDPDQLRQTSLEVAIIELFILAHCSKFYGTVRENGYMVSAFSILAKQLNEAKKKNILPMFESGAATRDNTFSPLFKKMKLINIKKSH